MPPRSILASASAVSIHSICSVLALPVTDQSGCVFFGCPPFIGRNEKWNFPPLLWRDVLP